MSRVEGELRASKGTLIFIPAGTAHYLRVESSLQLPEGFRAGKARLTLRQSAEIVRDAGKRAPGIEPADGVPESVCGPVLERGEGELVLDVGFPLHLTLPADSKQLRNVYALLRPPLRADDAELL